GDQYRASLKALAREVGVESHVILHDRFVSPEEMAEFIGAADIYITPYRYEAQVVSGTLATFSMVISPAFLGQRKSENRSPPSAFLDRSKSRRAWIGGETGSEFKTPCLLG